MIAAANWREFYRCWSHPFVDFLVHLFIRLFGVRAVGQRWQLARRCTRQLQKRLHARIGCCCQTFMPHPDMDIISWLRSTIADCAPCVMRQVNYFTEKLTTHTLWSWIDLFIWTLVPNE
jgi:hypothetical protein